MPVTAEQLTAVLMKSRNSAACARLFDSLDEPDRRPLAKVALNWYRSCLAVMNDRPAPRGAVPLPTSPGFLIDAVTVAVLATASWTEFRRLSGWIDRIGSLDSKLVEQVVLQRRPDWFVAWADSLLAANPDHWPLVRRLQRAGLGSPAENDDYVVGMLAGIDSMYVRDGQTIRSRLEADPELLESLIWRLFEVQRPQNLNFAARDSYRNSSRTNPGSAQTGWIQTFVELAHEGILDRNRLLESSLAAVERGFPDTTSRWFTQLHEALAPSLEERQGFLDRYGNLLRSPNASSANFSLEVLTRLDDAEQLSAEFAATVLPDVLLDRTRSRVKKALDLLNRSAARAPENRQQVAVAATRGLCHESPDIQKAAWDLIVRWGVLSDDIRDLIRQAEHAITPTLRPKVLEWLDASSVDDFRPAPRPVEIAANASDAATGILSTIPEAFRTAAGLVEPSPTSTLQSPRNPLPEVDLRSPAIPRLRDSIAPVTSLDELIDACAAALEQLETPEELERLLDGISRLCDQRPADFQARTSPLKQRALKRLAARAAAVFFGDDIVSDFYATIWAWLTGEVPRQTIVQTSHQNLRGSTAGNEQWPAFPPAEPCWLRLAVSQQIQHRAARAARGVATPVLSTPTHRGGWIDPRVLVTRLASHPLLTQVPEFELTLSLLRLAPDTRATALDQLQSLSIPDSEYCDALRYALGADGIAVGPTAALWSAAARARSPWGNDVAVALRHPDQGPDSGHAAQFVVTAIPAVEHPGKLILKVVPERRALPTLPTTEHLPAERLRDDDKLPAAPDAPGDVIRLLYDGLPRFWLCPSGPLTVDMALTLWPASCAPLLARAVFHLLKNRDAGERLWAGRSYLKALCDPDRELTDLAYLVLWVGLASKVTGEPEMAAEAILAAITDGRFEGGRAGTVLQLALSTGLFKVSRWASGLQEIARPSELHAEAIRTTLERIWVATTDSKIRDLALMLELYVELQAASGLPVCDTARPWFSQFQGTGRGKTLVKAILALQPQPADRYWQSVHQLNLRGRIERAQRWAANSKSSSS